MPGIVVGLQGSAMCRVKLEDDRVIVRHFDQLRPRQGNGVVENTENDSDDSLVLEENGNSTEVPIAEQAPLSETEESVTTQSTVNAEGTADSSLPLEQPGEDRPDDTVAIEPSTESQDENTSSQVRRSSRVTKPPVRYM